MTPDVLIRPATLEDRSFIIDSWLRSYRNSEFGRRIPDDVWGSRYGHAGFVEDIVDRFGYGLPSLDQLMLGPPVSLGVTAVACLPTDPAFVFGFAVFGILTRIVPFPPLHFLYVKKDYRRAGVGKQLLAVALSLAPGPMPVTAETPAWKAFAAKHGIAYEYRHPYRKER